MENVPFMLLVNNGKDIIIFVIHFPRRFSVRSFGHNIFTVVFYIRFTYILQD